MKHGHAPRFGYLDRLGHGTVALVASHNDDVDTLAVTVPTVVYGGPPRPATVPALRARRGRGITLMPA